MVPASPDLQVLFLLYPQTCEDATRKSLVNILMNELIHLAMYQDTKQNADLSVFWFISHLYTNNKHIEKEMKDTIAFVIVLE